MVEKGLRFAFSPIWKISFVSQYDKTVVWLYEYTAMCTMSSQHISVVYEYNVFRLILLYLAKMPHSQELFGVLCQRVEENIHDIWIKLNLNMLFGSGIWFLSEMNG